MRIAIGITPGVPPYSCLPAVDPANLEGWADALLPNELDPADVQLGA